MNIEQSIQESRLEKGEELFRLINSFTQEEKNALIGFRCISRDPDGTIQNDDLKGIDIGNTIDVLADFGICFIDEARIVDLLGRIKQNHQSVFTDHEAWSVFTVLEVDEHIDAAESHFEAYIIEDGLQINDIPIDLVGDADPILLIECKFNAKNDHDTANRRGRELQEHCEELDSNAEVILGTLSIQYKQRMLQYIDNFDRIIHAEDILDFSNP